jgi:hypothetical protein
LPAAGTAPSSDEGPRQQLQYVIADRRGAPGLIVTIGVLSIVVASLSGIFSLFTCLQAVGLYMMSVMTSSMAASQSSARMARASVSAQATPALTVQADGSPAVGPRGMRPKEREAIVAALNRRRPMTPSRKRQLDGILALAGLDMATDAVTDSGTMPEMRSGEAPPDFFTTPAGRLELFNDRAVFYPPSGQPVRVSVPPEGMSPPAPQQQPAPVREAEIEVKDSAVVPASTAPTGAPTTAPALVPLVPGLTSAEIQSVVQQAQAGSGNALNPAQVSALQSFLAAPGQQLVQAGASQGAVVSSLAQSDGTVLIGFSGGGSLTLGPRGNVVSTAAAPVIPTFSFHPLAIGLMLATALASIGLAIYLLVCGILMIRQSPRGRRLHLVYACIKIPLAVTAAVASEWVMRDMMAGVTSTTGAMPRPIAFSVFTGVVPALLGCVYPVALLVALNRKSVRDYFDYGGAAGAGRTAAG